MKVLPSRRLRKLVTQTGGFLSATTRTLAAVPTGLVDSLTRVTAPETPATTRAKRTRLTRLCANAALAAGAGLLVGGPVGAVSGLGISFISSALSNVAEAQNGRLEQYSQDVAQAVEKGLPRGKLQALLAGTVEACRSEWHHGRIAGAATTAGCLDGLEAITDRGSTASDGDQHHRWWNRAARTVTGILGAAINLPGGIVAGSLHAMLGPQAEDGPNMRPLLMLCTGLGKALVPAVLGGIVAGPVGAAVASGFGILVDVTVDGINTITDGKKGLNHSIVGSIDKQLEKALPDEFDEGYGVYYRQGQGAVIGGATCLVEGWKRGYYGGSEAVQAMIESPVSPPPPAT